MDIEKYKESITSERQGLWKHMFIGEGEPLLHPEIAEFVTLPKNLVVLMSFTTNAFKLSNKFVESSLKNISWIKSLSMVEIEKLTQIFIVQMLRILM